MYHANARLTVHGRALLVSRVVFDRRPVAHVAKELGVSRQCAHRWVKRFDAGGWPALVDRSSRPHRSPRRTPVAVEDRIVSERLSSRRGPDWLAAELGVAARTVTRVLRRREIPRLVECDPLTGEVIRASRRTAVRYERARPGELVHVDVKKIGKIPDGGGWRATAAENAPAASEAWAMTMSTPRSMTTHGWPLPRSSPTRKAPPAPASSPAPQRSSPPTASTASTA